MDFITKKAYSGRGEGRNRDVLVSVTSNRNRKDIVFSFSYKAKTIAFGQSEYGVIAFSEDLNRIYFKGEDRINGYKLSKSTKDLDNSLRVMKVGITTKMVDAASKKWLGYYSIKFCPTENLWYIDINDKSF